MVETVTVVRSSLDPSNFEIGIQRMEAAARRGADTVSQANARAGGSWVQAGTAAERYVKQVEGQYASLERQSANRFRRAHHRKNCSQIRCDLAEWRSIRCAISIPRAAGQRLRWDVGGPRAVRVVAHRRSERHALSNLVQNDRGTGMDGRHCDPGAAVFLGWNRPRQHVAVHLATSLPTSN